MAFEGTFQETTPTNGTWFPRLEEKFICETCVNYHGGCGCDKMVFIPYQGCNTNGCSFYEKGVKCRHCGRVT